MDDGWHEYEPPTLCTISMGLGISIMVERGATPGAAPPPVVPGNLLWGAPDGLFWDVDRLVWSA